MLRASACASGSLESPGPTTTASARPIALSTGSTPDASRYPSPFSGSPTTIASNSLTVKLSSRLAGAPTVT